MGQLTNLYVSQSYQGLLKMTDSTNGLTNTLQTVQTGDGDNSPLQMSLTQVNITGSLTVNGQPISVDTGSLVTKTEFNSYTSSVDLRFDGIELETGSLQNQINQKLNTGSFNSYTSSVNTKLAGLDIETGSLQNQINGLATTGSLSGYTTVTTFNNYTGSNDAKVNDLISKTGSYATTGSNNFVGQQNINGSVNVTGSVNITGTVTATSASFTYVNTVYETASVIYSSGSNQLGDASNDTQTLWGTVVLPSGSLDITGSIKTDVNGLVDSGIFLNSRGQVNLFGNGDVNLQSTSPTGSITLNSKTKVDGNVVVTGSVTATQGFTGSLQGTASYATNALSASWAPDNSNRDGLITTGSAASVQSITGSLILSGSAGPELDVKGDTTITGSLNITGSFNLINNSVGIDNNTISSLGASAFNSLNLISNNVNLTATTGGGVNINATQTRNTGSFRSKGFVEIRSGSLFTISNNTTINIDNYLTSSEAGQSNIIKGWSDAPAFAGPPSIQSNFTGSLRITGSNNMVSMPQIRATSFGGGTDSQGYISGSDNMILSNNAGMYLNTGSQIFPRQIGNILSAGSAIVMNFTTSSLAGNPPAIQQNLLLGGAVTLNSNSGSINSLVGNAIIGGAINSTQNFVTNQRPLITGNNVIGAVTLNHISSSINYQSNYNNSPITINNHLSSSISLNSFNFINNAVFGGSNATGLGVWVSGSQSSNAQRNISDNLFGGRNIIVSSSFVSSSNSNLYSSIVYGHNLNVSGSHVATGGSAFFGRFNDTGSLADTQNVVFAVGTGNATANRRTGLWIDQGSNTKISGSLDVKGVTNALVVTGSANITHGIAGQAALTVVNSVGVTQNGLVVSGTTSLTGDVTISGSNPLRVGTYNNEGVIKTLGGQPWLYRNTDTYNTVVGNIQAMNTGFPSGSEKNMVFNGFFSPFATGSNNVIIQGAGDDFLSGSNNVFIGSHNGQIGGSNNLLIGATSYPSSTTFDNKFELGTQSTPRIFHKNGSDPLQIGDDTQVTGSLRVSGDIMFSSGSNTTMGTAVLDGGNPGTVTVSNNLVSANSLIFLTKQTLTNAHMVAVTSKGTNTFTITSNGNGDTDTVAYLIINPA